MKLIEVTVNGVRKLVNIERVQTVSVFQNPYRGQPTHEHYKRYASFNAIIDFGGEDGGFYVDQTLGQLKKLAGYSE